MARKSFLELYARYLRQMGIKLPPFIYMGFCCLVSAATALFLFFFLAPLLPLLLPGRLLDVAYSMTLVLPFLIFIVLIDLLIGYPWQKGLSRIAEIERSFPDALKQMADILRAGGTYELALREISLGEYGPLREEIKLVLRRLEEGASFEDALRSLPRNIDSKLVLRTINIVVDSIRAGAGLADVLEDISADVREANRVVLERKSRTLLQAMFLVATAAVVAPYIFGVATALVSLFVQTAVAFEMTQAELMLSSLAGARIIFMLQVYILIEVVASSAMLALMREGKLNKAIIYFPWLLLSAFLIFFFSRITAVPLLLGGA